MKRISGLATASLIAGALMFSGSVMAHDQARVSWSLSIGAPYYPAPVYSPPPVVYAPPQPVHMEPQPVYMEPRPVYMEMESRPAVQYGNYAPQPYYMEQERHMYHRHWRHHHRYED